MMRNMGTTDRIIRIILGLAAVLIASLVSMNGALQIILWVIGGILLVTAAIGFCPLYRLVHCSTKSRHT
jgi:hypothetical protein